MSHAPFNRRQALAGFASLLAASPLLKSQDVPVPELIGEEPGRIAPADNLANTFEFEPMAQRRLNEETFAAIADGDHAAWDRITFRQRMVDTSKLDLTTDLFGDAHFTPILVGPASHQKRFHPEGELAMAEGASAGKAALIASDRSDHPIEEIAAKATSSLWYQVYPEADVPALIGRIRKAKAAGCKAVCLTVGSPASDSSLVADWDYVDRIRQATDAPFLLKGVMSPEEAQTAADKGVNGVIVSNHGGKFLPGIADPIAMLPAISEALNGRIPVLIDGGIRRGADVLKALALGAAAVLIARPALWALAAYGADGVQTLVELLQTELASDMTMLGTITPAAVTRDHVKVHRR
ncbi:MAG: alpha-hydroxy-acid oxidizing protein [Acidobacteria bacterium]|nr:alpha-hydroxy-acid oxidizing protein [Acidobacteriota bacterium]MDA1236387.1 alpha-hydroxy-acid oxidizing protein [Acidobacteriota bacterium]